MGGDTARAGWFGLEQSVCALAHRAAAAHYLGGRVRFPLPHHTPGVSLTRCLTARDCLVAALEPNFVGVICAASMGHKYVPAAHPLGVGVEAPARLAAAALCVVVFAEVEEAKASVKPPAMGDGGHARLASYRVRVRVRV